MKRFLITLAALAAALPATAKEKTFFGNYDDYGGNVSAEVGRGYGYITSKKKHVWHEEESVSSGYIVNVRWEWRDGNRRTPPSNQRYNVVCSHPLVFSDGGDKWYGIELNKPVEKYTSDAFGSDLWFTVCRGDPNRY